MTKHKHTENDVLKSLQKKHDVIVNPNTKQVIVNVGTVKKNDLGNGSHGKIDFLKNFCGYALLKSQNFNTINKFKK